MHPHQPFPLVRNHILRIPEQLPAVGRAQPRGVGLGEGILLAGEGGAPVGEASVVGGAERAAGDAGFHVGVVKGAAGGDPAVGGRGRVLAANVEVDFEARTEHAVGDGGDGTIEIGGGSEGGACVGGDWDGVSRLKFFYPRTGS